MSEQMPEPVNGEIKDLHDLHKLTCQLLLNADRVSRERGNEIGLCDAIDNHGNPYQSDAMASVLEYIRIGNRPRD